MNKKPGHYFSHILPLAAVITIFLIMGMVSCKNDTNKQAKSGAGDSVISSGAI